MRRPSLEAPLRIMLLSKTLVPRSSGAWEKAAAPWALGAFTLRRYIETRPELAARVAIDIRSYPKDETLELILHEVVRERPDVVGFTCQPWNHADHIKLSRLLMRLVPGLVVVHGGPMVLYRRQYLERLGPEGVSVIVEGEAEESFAELLEHWVFGTPALADVAGIGTFDADGKPLVTAERSNPDLARLPTVMTPENLAAMGSYVLYETARGCPFRCSFCNWGSQKARLRTRARDVIERDLAAILSRPEVTHLWITDAGIDISTEHALFLADVIRRHKRPGVQVVGYFFLLHADLSYVERLVGAFDTLQLGLQTANEHTLSEMGRKALSVERFDRIIDAVLPVFDDLRVDLLYGLPGIGIDELRRSVRFLLRKGIWLINLYRLIAIPGTEMAEHKERYGLVADEEFPFNVYASQGCTVEDLFEMQQFKVNFDTLRPMFARGALVRAEAAGVDLLDFVARLHTLVPRFNHRAEYGLEMDREVAPELLRDIHAGIAQYTADPTARRVIEQALRAAFPAAGAGEVEARAGAATRARPSLPAPPPPGIVPPAPSSALRGLTAALGAAIGPFVEPASAVELLPRWRAFVEEGRHLEGLGVHVHVPFCRTICTYCDCSTEALGGDAQLDRYLDTLTREMAFVAPVAADLALERLYIGGGTPNLLSAQQLDRMLALIDEHHRFVAGAVRCLEGDPRQSTREKLEVARRRGINRLSLGVQALDATTLRRVNRSGQTPQMVEQAVAEAHALGFPEVNLDLLFGLAEESTERALEAATWALGLEPSTLCIQLLNDSHFASPYRDVQHRAAVAHAFHDFAGRLAQRVEASAPAYGVAIRPDTVVVHRRGLWRAWDSHLEYYSARDRTRRSTLGYGLHAQSTLFGALRYQNQDRGSTWSAEAPLYATRAVTPAVEALSDVVAALEFERRVDIAPLSGAYGAEALGELEPLLDALTAAGHLRREGSVYLDTGLAPEAVKWLAGRLQPASGAGAPPLAPTEHWSLRVREGGSTWHIQLEPARPGARYFGVAGGLGVFYRTGTAQVDPARSASILRAVLQEMERAGAGEPGAAVAARVAEFLDRRLARAGIRVELEVQRERRHRLTVVATG